MPGCGSSGVPALPQGRVLVSVPRQQCAAPSCDLHDPAVLHILELALHHQVAILFEVRRKAGRLRAPKPQLTVPPVHPAGTRDEQVPIWVLCDGHIIVLPLATALRSRSLRDNLRTGQPHKIQQRKLAVVHTKQPLERSRRTCWQTINQLFASPSSTGKFAPSAARIRYQPGFHIQHTLLQLLVAHVSLALVVNLGH
eukprot:CAMPEP_0114121786 /NCGR_PEP_ID=MMETSP0043_2-20121206/7357_1 /TAXON_ID=464988 /ORGANISM="Hemiselmis andersenii, Strain CCMP644" /LENGTH=196 /DNA_ID=CAMNT_0001214477 /DNA_START=305 /DNA_END=895 /DNA_ORIENTATION=-